MYGRRPIAAALMVASALAAGCGASDAPKEAPSRPAARTAVVPNLLGIEQGRARARAARRGFQMSWAGFAGRLSNGHTNVACAKVLRQSPVAGERRAPGASISVIEVACHTPRGEWHDAAGVPPRRHAAG